MASDRELILLYRERLNPAGSWRFASVTLLPDATGTEMALAAIQARESVAGQKRDGLPSARLAQPPR